MKSSPGGRTAPHRPNGRVAFGLLLIGTGRPAGFAQFGGSTEAFLASLAPLLGFLIVIGGLVAWSGHPAAGVTALLVGLCALLAPAVIADLFTRRWARGQHWALYANVLNCAQWLMLAVLLLLLPVASTGVALGLSPQEAAEAVMVVFGIYVLWFHWFTARHVLEISRPRALLVMACVVFGSGLLLQLPGLLAGEPATPPFLAPPADGAAGTPT